MGPSARRSTLAKEFRGLPECLDAADRFSRKVVGADKERIIVQRLGARRLVVGIVQANQSVSQKRGQLTARLVNLSGRSGRRLEDLWYIGLHLHVSVMIVVDSRRPFGSLAVREDGPRHLKFPGLGSQADHPLRRRFPSRLFGQRVPEGQKRVERDQSLVVEYGADPGGKLAMYLISLGSTLPRPRQQVDDFVLRRSGLAGRKPEYLSQ